MMPTTYANNGTNGNNKNLTASSVPQTVGEMSLKITGGEYEY